MSAAWASLGAAVAGRSIPATSISAPIVSATHADEPPTGAFPFQTISLPGAVPTQGSPPIERHEASDRLGPVEKEQRRAWAVGPVVSAIGHVGLITILILVRVELPAESQEGLPVEIVVEAAAPKAPPSRAATPTDTSDEPREEPRQTQPRLAATAVPRVEPPPSTSEAPIVTTETSVAPLVEPLHPALVPATPLPAAPLASEAPLVATAEPPPLPPAEPPPEPQQPAVVPRASATSSPAPEAPLASVAEPPPLPPVEPPPLMPQPALVPPTQADPPTERSNAPAPPQQRAAPVPPPGLKASNRSLPVKSRLPVAVAARSSVSAADPRAEHERQRRQESARVEAAAAAEERAEVRRAPRREADGARAAARLASLGASPAQSGPSEDAMAEIAGYSQHVAASIAAMKHYPEEARARAAQGIAVVSFAIDAGGEVRSAAIGRSSGDAGLDAEAVATVRRVGSFGPPPRGAPRTFSVPLRYQMR